MIRILVEHARRHAIAYVALAGSVLALGGAAYASFQVPINGVGERQIQNHVIDPVKWDTAYVTGFVRRWATVNANGTLASTSPGGQSHANKVGNVVVTWGDAFASWCAPIATVKGGSASSSTTTTTTTSSSSSTTTSSSSSSSSQPSGGFADASIVTRSGQSTLVAVATFNAQGQPTPEPFSVAVICGPGAGSAQTFPTNLP
jgi:hypothetical protein